MTDAGWKSERNWKPSGDIEQCQVDCRMWRQHYYEAEEARVELSKRVRELEAKLAQQAQDEKGVGDGHSQALVQALPGRGNGQHDAV